MSSEVIEFQAVILAGGAGNRMYPLTEGIPKPLLPIATRPLLSYQLELLEKAGFNEAIVVTQPGMEAMLRKYCNEGYAGKIRVRLCVMPSEHKDGGAAYGTADALRFVKDKIKTDFFVISGDLISDVYLHYLADLHRTRHSSLTVLLKDTSAPAMVVPSAGAAAGLDSKHSARDSKSGAGGKSAAGGGGSKPAAASSGAPPPSSGKKNAMDDLDKQFIGLDEKTNRLVLFKSASDVEDGFTVTKALLKRVPNLSIHSRLKDAHLYIFNRAVLKLLDEQKSISSIQGELVPYLVQLQFSPQAAKWAAVSGATSQAKALSMSHSSLATPVTELKPDQWRQLQDAHLQAQQQQHAIATAQAMAAAGANVGGSQPSAIQSASSIAAAATPAMQLAGSSAAAAAANLLPSASPLLRQQSSAITALMAPVAAPASLATLLSSNSAAQLLANANQQQTPPIVLVPEHPVQCYAYLAPPQTYLMRVNTVPTYIQANFDLATMPHSESAAWTPIASTNHAASVIARSQHSQPGAVAIGGGCVIGDGLKIGAASASASSVESTSPIAGPLGAAKAAGGASSAAAPSGAAAVASAVSAESVTSLKRVVVGKHCKIGAGCRLSGSILMDHVTIEDGCTIENTVICSDSIVQKKSTLRECRIGTSFVIPAATEAKNETLCKERE